MNRIVREDLETIVKADIEWSAFDGKTVLITGASGFLPAYLVETLLYLNETIKSRIKIIALVRNKERALSRFDFYKDRQDLEIIEQDVCEPLKTNSKIDFIIHAASQASPKYYGSDPVGTLSANVIGTHNLLSTARDNAVEGFLYFSSGEVYGEVLEDKIPTREDFYGYLDPTNVRSCYAESKRMAETMCVSWFHQFGVPAKIVRPFHTYGPGMQLDDGRVYADFVANVLNGENIIMKSDGSATRSFCYLTDATIGFFTVLLKGENAQAYNVGNDACEISIIELADRIIKLFPEKQLKLIEQKRSLDTNYIKSQVSRSRPDIGKLAGLGWHPTVSIEQGFRRTVESFNEN